MGNLQIALVQPAYRWQHNLRVDWTSPKEMFGGGLSNRFYSRYIDEYPDANGSLRMVGSYSLWDAYAVYKPTSNWPCYLESRTCSIRFRRSPMPSKATLRPGTTSSLRTRYCGTSMSF